MFISTSTVNKNQLPTPLDSWDNDLPFSNREWCLERIHRRNNGKWWLHGKGGPESAYATGELVRQLTEDEALEWLAEKGHPFLVERYFPNRLDEARSASSTFRHLEKELSQ
jgi:hypothetical protein